MSREALRAAPRFAWSKSTGLACSFEGVCSWHCGPRTFLKPFSAQPDFITTHESEHEEILEAPRDEIGPRTSHAEQAATSSAVCSSTGDEHFNKVTAGKSSKLDQQTTVARTWSRMRELPSVDEVRARLRSSEAATCSNRNNTSFLKQYQGAEEEVGRPLDWREAVRRLQQRQAAPPVRDQVLVDTFRHVAILCSS
jgi:hypothetical protein